MSKPIELDLTQSHIDRCRQAAVYRLRALILEAGAGEEVGTIDRLTRDIQALDLHIGPTIPDKPLTFDTGLTMADDALAVRKLNAAVVRKERGQIAREMEEELS